MLEQEKQQHATLDVREENVSVLLLFKAICRLHKTPIVVCSLRGFPVVVVVGKCSLDTRMGPALVLQAKAIK